jgi:ATP-dependent helicase IRC3
LSYQRHAAGRKTLVFVRTVALAYRVASLFRDAGIATEGLDGNTAPERRRGVLDRLRTGEVTVVVNAALLTEGFDEPSVSCIVVATPTRSQVKYTQLVGRGLRTFPGKDDCLVIDVVGVTDRLDLQTFPRLFGLRNQTSAGETVIEAIDRQTRQDRASEQAPAAAAARRRREGAMRSRDVQLLGSRKRGGKLHWLRHGDYWLVSIGRGGLIALVPAGERWTVLRLDRDQVQRLAVDIDLGYAHGIAEDMVRQTGALRLADVSARWRRAPMNDAQASLLRRLGITPPDGASKGEASDLITLARGAALLDRLTREAA